MQHINEEQWNDMVDLLEEDFISLVQGYLLDSQMHLATIKIAHKNNNNENALDAAHTMKGASANIGATALEKHCATMQTICHAHMIDSAFNVIDDIEKELTTVTMLINKKLAEML